MCSISMSAIACLHQLYHQRIAKLSAGFMQTGPIVKGERTTSAGVTSSTPACVSVLFRASHLPLNLVFCCSVQAVGHCVRQQSHAL